MRTNRAFLIAAAALVFAALPATAQAAKKPTQEELERAAKEAEAAKELSGTSWSITLSPLSGEKPKKPLTDTLTFDGTKLTSQATAKEGYAPANCTVTVPDGATVVWETMQSKEGAGVVFWRGERRGDRVSGIISKQPASGNSADFSFSGALNAPAAPAVPATPPAPAAQGQVPAAQTPSAQTAAPAPAQAQQPAKPAPAPEKKKKGWGWW